VVGEFIGRALGRFALGLVVGAAIGAVSAALVARSLRGHGTPITLTIDSAQLRFLFLKGKIVDVVGMRIRSGR